MLVRLHNEPGGLVMVGKIGRRGRGVVGVLGVMAMTGVAFAQPVGADDGASVDAVTVVEDLVGNQTAGGVVAAGGDTAVVVATAGTVVDVPMDPSDGIAVDLAGSGADVAITPLDPGLDDFARDGAMATAEGDGYATVIQPLVGGDLRLAVTLDDPSAPRSLTYELDLPEGTRVVQRPDGGFDFVAVDGALTGGLAAPWAIDANGNPVSVVYHHDGNGRITRHVLTDADTAYPVIANFCIFGKNPNGSCRNPARGAVNHVKDNWPGWLAGFSAGMLVRLTCYAAFGGFTITTSGAAAAAYPTAIAACNGLAFLTSQVTGAVVNRG